MTAKQKYLFWREWNQAKRWYMEHGELPGEAEARRPRLIREALGYDKSMTVWRTWKNAELDKVLAKFRAVYDGGNLDAQLAAEEQPEARRRQRLAEAINLAREVWPQPPGADAAYEVMRKLSHLAKRRCHIPIDDCDEGQLVTIIIELTQQQRRNARKAVAAAPAPAPVPVREQTTEDVPF